MTRGLIPKFPRPGQKKLKEIIKRDGGRCIFISPKAAQTTTD